MKNLARTLIRESKAYGDALQPPEFEGGNQLKEQELIRGKVVGLLDEGAFLHGDGRDSEVLLIQTSASED